MSKRPFVPTSAAAFLLLAVTVSHAAIVVTQNEKGFQFVDAVSLTVNSKDKVLSLGSDPTAQSANGKLPSIKLDEALFQDRATSLFILVSEGSRNYVIPEGLPKGTQPDAKSAWQGSHISLKASDKTRGDIFTSSFVAFLPGDLAALVNLARSEQDVRLIDSSESTFATQLNLISAIVTAYPKDQLVAGLQRFVLESMRSRYELFQNGLANVEVLNQALKFSDLSRSIYPSVPEQAKLCDQLAQLKFWLERKVAVLRALAAGNSWDQFIVGDGDFDQYEKSFPEIGHLRVKALQTSLEQHRKAGEEFFSEHEFGSAFRQFRVASFRQPSDKLLQQRVTSSWASYSREVALDKQSERKQLSVGEREILNQAIQFATNYRAENKLDLALKSVMEAESVDPNSLPMLLKKAEILGMQSEFAKAFAVLDRYDLLAIDDEREKASVLRNELLFKQKSSLEDVKEQLRKASAGEQYMKVYELAMKGLRASDSDPDILFQAATAARISRQAELSRTLFQRYLSITNTLDANATQRLAVRSLLASSTLTSAGGGGVEGLGEPNWLSGKKLAPGVFYCPISLAFQPKIEHIEASGKMKVSYEWSGNQLLSITPTFEKADKNTGERRINFAYEELVPQVVLATEGGARAPLAQIKDPDEVLKHSSLIVLNNPYIDPDSVEKLTGKNVSLGISGNKFFEPFVWDRIHYFRFAYDALGRVSAATELPDAGGAISGITLSFDWEGPHLTAIHGYQGIDARHRTKIYDRIMEYQDGQLVAEDISGSGKPSHIKYIYNGNRMVSAQSTSDATLDDRSRQVTFR